MALKTVLYPIKVPSGDYCWEWTGEHWICPHFDNEGGDPKCDLGFRMAFRKIEDCDGVKKSSDCMILKELKD